MMGSQCDNCRKFAVAPNEGWFVLMQVPPAASTMMSLIGMGGGPEIAGTFCSARCVAEYTFVLAATGSTGSPS